PQIGPAGIADLARLAWNVAGHDVVFGILLGGAIAIAIRLIVGQLRTGDQVGAIPITLASWLCVPVVLSFAATQRFLNLHLFAWGYLVVVIPALCLLAAIGVVAVRHQLLRVAFTVALVIGAVIATPEYSAAPSQDFRAWFDANYRMVGEIVVPSSLGPVRVRLYETAHPAYL